jgi:hypothetical protein
MARAISWNVVETRVARRVFVNRISIVPNKVLLIGVKRSGIFLKRILKA